MRTNNFNKMIERKKNIKELFNYKTKSFLEIFCQSYLTGIFLNGVINKNITDLKTTMTYGGILLMYNLVKNFSFYKKLFNYENKLNNQLDTRSMADAIKQYIEKKSDDYNETTRIKLLKNTPDLYELAVEELKDYKQLPDSLKIERIKGFVEDNIEKKTPDHRGIDIISFLDQTKKYKNLNR